MNDFFGRRLEVGRVVAISIAHYSDLEIGTIAGFTKKRVNVVLKDVRHFYVDENGDRTHWCAGAIMKQEDCTKTMNVDPERLVMDLSGRTL